MDKETIKRAKGDFNQTNISKKMNSMLSYDQQGTNQSYLQEQDQTEKTFYLTILFDNMIDLNLKEIIALYDKIDKKNFNHQLSVDVTLAEFNQFDDASQLENQRIVIHQYKNTLVLAGVILQTNQLIVIKIMKVDSQEILIQNLDEYKIHHRINQLFPSQSLELIIPVRVSKVSNYYEIAACMERAQFNLYDYSRNHQIKDEEAMNIFVQILDQLINLHSVYIAHRDIKPQNIFYVKEKGWLLSDFGESLEYEQVDGLYNIRGTKYFLLPALQSSINKNGKYNQNLITNDTYALVVCMIMIKNQQYIYDMKDQIENLQDQLLKSATKLSNLSQLIEYRSKIKYNLNKSLINLSKQFYKQMEVEEQNLNNKCNLLSQMEYFKYLNNQNGDPIWLQKILQLIKKNVKFILQKFNSTLGIMLTNLCLFQKIQIDLELDRKWIKIIQSKPLQQQQFYIQLLFIYGYTEITIKFATEYLKLNYSQSVHLVLIDSYYRANMRLEAEQQLKQFHEGMVFDQLNTSSQENYLQYLQYLYEEQQKYNIQFDFNIEQELKDRGYQYEQGFMTEFLNEQKLLQDEPYLNKESIVNSIITRINKMCREFSLFTRNFCPLIFQYALDQPLFVLLPLLQQIYQQNYGQFDTNKKFNFLYQIAEILNMVNNQKEFMTNLKLMKKSVFYSESWQQSISFKILYQTIFLMEYVFQEAKCKFNINLYMKKFVIELRKIRQIKFQCYFQYILGSLLNLIKIAQIYQIYHKNHYLVYIIQFIINLAFKHNFHITEPDNFQSFHIQAQCILIDLKNDNRSQLLVIQQRKFLNNQAIQVIKEKKIDPLNLLIRSSIKKLLRIRIIGSQQIRQIVMNKFIFNRYFE